MLIAIVLGALTLMLLGLNIVFYSKNGPLCALGVVVTVVGLFFMLVSPAIGHDHNDPVNDAWMKTLMQPDNPAIPCCGKADAYWCDNYYVRDGRAFCKITDDRADEPLGRPHIPVGTEIEIPNHKLKWDRGNPTGHAVVFVSRSLLVHCFVQSTGI